MCLLELPTPMSVQMLAQRCRVGHRRRVAERIRMRLRTRTNIRAACNCVRVPVTASSVGALPWRGSGEGRDECGLIEQHVALRWQGVHVAMFGQRCHERYHQVEQSIHRFPMHLQDQAALLALAADIEAALCSRKRLQPASRPAARPAATNSSTGTSDTNGAGPGPASRAAAAAAAAGANPSAGGSRAQQAPGSAQPSKAPAAAPTADAGMAYATAVRHVARRTGALQLLLNRCCAAGSGGGPHMAPAVQCRLLGTLLQARAVIKVMTVVWDGFCGISGFVSL